MKPGFDTAKWTPNKLLDSLLLFSCSFFAIRKLCKIGTFSFILSTLPISIVEIISISIVEMMPLSHNFSRFIVTFSMVTLFHSSSSLGEHPSITIFGRKFSKPNFYPSSKLFFNAIKISLLVI